MQKPVAVSKRFSPLYEVKELGQEINIDDTLNDSDYEFSDLEGDLDILELNSCSCVNITNYDEFDKLLLIKESIRN